MRRVSALWNWRYDKQKWPVSFISLSKPIERSNRIMLLDLNWKRSSFNNISSNAFWKFLPIYQVPRLPVIMEMVNRTNFFGKYFFSLRKCPNWWRHWIWSNFTVLTHIDRRLTNVVEVLFWAVRQHTVFKPWSKFICHDHYTLTYLSHTYFGELHSSF